MGSFEKKDNSKIIEITYQPHKVYVAGGQTNPSYSITIPKPFALALKLDRPHSFVITRLISEEMEERDKAAAATTDEGNNNNSSRHRKRKRPYLIIEKLPEY